MVSCGLQPLDITRLTYRASPRTISVRTIDLHFPYAGSCVYVHLQVTISITGVLTFLVHW